MPTLIRLLASCAIAAVITQTGCAPAYHSYPGCHVECRYCPPPPIPHVHYPGCVCHSCAALRHINASTPVVSEVDAGVAGVVPVD